MLRRGHDRPPPHRRRCTLYPAYEDQAHLRHRRDDTSTASASRIDRSRKGQRRAGFPRDRVRQARHLQRLRQQVRKRCYEVRIPGAAYGLHKAAATKCTENGATAQELVAMFGWTSVKEESGILEQKRISDLASRILEVYSSSDGIPFRLTPTPPAIGGSCIYIQAHMQHLRNVYARCITNFRCIYSAPPKMTIHNRNICI